MPYPLSMSQAVINTEVQAPVASAWRALASVASTPATRPNTTAAHAYRAYAATAAKATDKHFMGGGSWSNLR